MSRVTKDTRDRAAGLGRALEAKEKALVLEIQEKRTAVALEGAALRAWEKFNEQRALVVGCEIILLKALGWVPCDPNYEDPVIAKRAGQARIDAGEPVLWSRGVKGESSFEQAEALALAERWWIDEQNKRGWRPAGEVPS